MKKYKITFIGRLLGAIGKTYKITETVEAANEKEAVLKLYDKYDCVHLPKIKGQLVER